MVIPLENSEQIVRAHFPDAWQIIKQLDNNIKLYNTINPPTQVDKILIIQNAFIIAQNHELKKQILITSEDIQRHTTVALTSELENLGKTSNLAVIKTLQNINSKLNSLEIIGERLTNLETSVKKLETKVENIVNISKGKGKEIIAYDNIAY